MGKYRDCNGVSNGTPLPPETIYAEEAAGPAPPGKPAGKVGPPPEVLRAEQHHEGPHHLLHPHPAVVHHDAHHGALRDDLHDDLDQGMYG